MIVGIDFDRVLFDTDAFDERWKQKVDGLHHTEEDVQDGNGNYSPAKQAEVLGLEPDEVYGAAAEIAPDFLYSDVERLEDIPAEVVVVTRGEKEFQGLKVEESGVLEHVDSYVVVENGDKQVGIDLLVDDREEELDRVDVPCFRFDRDRHTIEDVVEWVKKHAA